MDYVEGCQTGSTYPAINDRQFFAAWFPALADRFEPDPGERDACIRFLGDKVAFARDVVPTLPEEVFEVFRPIFDFVQAKAT